MTKKRQRFVEAYLQCGNASEAARRAGYSAKSAGAEGHRLLKIAEVAAEIERGQQRLRSTHPECSPEAVQAGLWKESQEAEKPRDRISAYGLLIKIMGMEAPKRREVQVTGSRPLEELSDEELRRLAEGV